MHVTDVIITLILFVLPLFILEFKKRKQIGGYGNFLKNNNKSKIHIMLHVLVGSYFVFTYLAFKYWHTPWYLFSYLHVYAMIATLIMPFALAYLVKGTNRAKQIAITMSAFLLLSPITRPFILYLDDGVYRTSLVDFEYAIPFNICNISALVYIIALLLPKHHVVANMLKNYMITLGFFGGIINNIQVHNGHVDYFWYYFNWESYIAHALIMIIPMFILLTGQLNVSKRFQAYNLIWIVPTYLLMGFVLNPWVGFNYWFTTPIDVLSMLPGQEQYLTLFWGTVYPIYMLILFLIVLLACAVLYGVFKYMEEKITPFFMDDRKGFDVWGCVEGDRDNDFKAATM